MKNLIVLLLIILMVAGCSRYIESENLDFDLPAEPVIPDAVKILHAGDGVVLIWETVDISDDISYRVYYSEDTLDTSYILWETTTDTSSLITSLTPGRVYYFAVASVDSNGLESNKSDPVFSTFGVVSLNINGGSRYTSSRNVSVTFVVPVTAALVELSEDPAFSETRWETYSTTKSFRLSQNDGAKYIYARIQFADGSESNSLQPIADTIILDTKTEIDTAYFNPSDIILARDSVITFTVITGEMDGSASISFPGRSGLELQYNVDASDSSAGIFVYSLDFTVPYNLELVDGVVRANFSDAAGNNAEEYWITEPLNISNPPLPVSLVAVAESSSKIRLNWSESANDDFAAYHIYRDTITTVSLDSEPIEVIISSATLTYSDTNLDDSTRYYYRVYVFDNTGLSAASEAVSAMTLVNAAPAAVILAARAEDGTVTLTWTSNNDEDFASYRVFRRNSTINYGDIPSLSPLQIINSQATTSYEDNPSSGTYHYVICVFDRQGKYSMSADVQITN